LQWFPLGQLRAALVEILWDEVEKIILSGIQRYREAIGVGDVKPGLP